MSDQNLMKVNGIATFFVIPMIVPVAILLIAGDASWLNGWLWGIQFLVLNVAIGLYLWFGDRNLLKERLRKPSLVKQVTAQTVLIYLMTVLYILWIIVMPLDAKRFHWTNGFPNWLEFIGLFALVPAFFLTLKSFTDNTYLSPLLRVQSERHQKVISKGAYSIVRHPMYLGTVLSFIGTPLFLGSRLGLGIGMVLTLLLFSRLLEEEKILVKGLSGYVAYQGKVKYRLIPFIW